ncbi:MAG: hypothetical protein QM594_18855, partial [Niabella sp.]
MNRIILFLVLVLTGKAAMSQRLMEALDRGVVAVPANDGKVLVSWRLLASDEEGIAFNVYRKTKGSTVRVNPKPVTRATSLLDDFADKTAERTYIVKPVIKNKETGKASSFVLKNLSDPYISIPLQIPDGYAANDGSVGDLDGDGTYEIVLHVAGRGRDNSQAGFTDPPLIQAYKLNGQLLWTIN